MGETDLSLEDVQHLAHLARLELSAAEVAQYQTELNAVLEMMSVLQTVRADNLEETAQVSGLVNVVREDQTDATLPISDVLANAPQHKDGHFIVPDVL